MRHKIGRGSGGARAWDFGMDVIIQVVIRGRVQGIGFRAWTEIAALELGVEGWVRNCRDGITYLIDAKRNGISTPRSGAYEHEILRRTQAHDLDEALRKIQVKD